MRDRNRKGLEPVPRYDFMEALANWLGRRQFANPYFRANFPGTYRADDD